MSKRRIIFCYGAVRAKQVAKEQGGEYISMMMHPMDVHKLLKRFNENLIGPLVCDKSMLIGWSINERVKQPIEVEFDKDFDAVYPTDSAEHTQAMARVRRIALTDTSGVAFGGEQVGELDDGGE